MSTNGDETSEPNEKITVEQARDAIRTLVGSFDTLTNTGTVNLQAADERRGSDKQQRGSAVVGLGHVPEETTRADQIGDTEQRRERHYS